MPPASLSLRAMGSCGVDVYASPVLQGKRRSIALIFYVAMTAPHRFTRASLAALLWPDSDEERARSSLRQALSDVRKGLEGLEEGALEITAHDVALDPKQIETDIDRMLSGIRDGSFDDDLSAEQIEASFFGGLWGLSEPLDTWLTAARGRFEQAIQKTCSDVMEQADLPVAHRIRAARLAVQLDPLNEDAARLAMAALAQMGETGPALRIYADLYERLDDELGMEPSRATQDLAVLIKTDDEGAPQSATPAQVAAATPSGAGANANMTQPPRLAILPFTQLGPHEMQPFFSYGIMDDMVSLMAQLRELRVYSSNSTRQLGAQVTGADAAPVLPTAGMPGGLEAEYCVSGSVRSDGNRFRVNVHLTDARSGLVEWASDYIVDDHELFDMQSELAASIAHQITPNVGNAELRRIEGTRPSDLGAYHLMLRAREIAFALDPTTFGGARGLLEMAVQRDPSYSTSQLAMADWLSIQLGQGWADDPAGDARALHETAERAVQLSGQSARALTRFAHNQTALSGYRETAVDTCRRALRAAPRDAETLLWSAPTLTFEGQTAQAIENTQAAIELSPFDPYIFRFFHFLSIAHYAAGEYLEAAEAGRRSFQANPHYTSNLRMTAAALMEIGEIDEARKMAGQVKRHDPNFRVGAFLAKQPFRDVQIGQKYASRLIEVGLPQ
ncbi:BTAD domain-containing putative transcriptional regulator [Thalassococcus lentus]|uniref:BTAD domain-containing putative transcriptional regulator n=1 Tax=Thalassococcus lentus TaxID=1210524 RepID=A0ABT4XTT0_9RHOB|nr:BTAD domain-containing putative transcriptional regulator [Thalassococcus lentus]MDA7425270.1 BTAD domain-containing putative transcriptional regulator [Thalassococcus lentus]